VSLDDFCENTYSIYQQNSNVLPKTSANFLNYVVENNIYKAYGSIEGIEKVLFHLSHRIKHNIWLNESVLILKTNETELLEHFNLFFKDAKNEFN
jgi:acyl carrier protein phosphodiesterase